jgi:hypothetical protein
MQRRRLYNSAEADPYAADLVRRLRGLLAIVTRPPATHRDPARRTAGSALTERAARRATRRGRSCGWPSSR